MFLLPVKSVEDYICESLSDRQLLPYLFRNCLFKCTCKGSFPAYCVVARSSYGNPGVAPVNKTPGNITPGSWQVLDCQNVEPPLSLPPWTDLFCFDWANISCHVCTFKLEAGQKVAHWVCLISVIVMKDIYGVVWVKHFLCVCVCVCVCVCMSEHWMHFAILLQEPGPK